MSVWPTIAGLGAAVWVTERSAAVVPVTCVDRGDELLARLGSGSTELTTTVFVTMPGVVGVAITVAVTLPAAGMVPPKQVTVPADWPQGPVLEDADTKMRLAGSMSEIVAFRAGLGPALVAVTK